ncbi:unnamed protein product, partial [Ectocarpus sp. 8 AP-2014]
MRRASTRSSKSVESAADVASGVEVAADTAVKRKRARQPKKGPKSTADRHAELDEHMRREASDPYHMRCPDLYPRCTREDHVRKKNCSNNPRCLYGLGEGKEGIWSRKPALIAALGEDMSGMVKELPSESTRAARAAAGGSSAGPGDAVVAFPPPRVQRQPTGLKNLGATCYLNSQLQALFANKAFRHGVFSWRPSVPAAGGEGGSSAGGSGANGKSDAGAGAAAGAGSSNGGGGVGDGDVTWVSNGGSG